VRGIAAGEQLAGEQQALAGLPGRHFFLVQFIEINVLGARVGLPRHRWPVGKLRRLELGRARAVEHEMRVPGGGAIRDHRHRAVGGVHRIGVDLHIEHGG
jgi:hypothetical protein